MKITAHAARGIPAIVLITLVSACSGGGGGGNGGGPNPPPADTTPPDTTLSGTPSAVTNSGAAAFTFTSSEGGSAFESRIDNGAFAATASPQNFTGLADGTHTFQVRARDGAGNVDATPASYTWVVDSTPPDTMVSGPAGPTNSPVYTASSNETGVVYEASLDGGTWVNISNPHTVSSTGLAQGAHTLALRARDAAGNLDASPITVNFIFDTWAPTARLQFPSRNFYTDGNTIHVRGTATDVNGVTAVSVNGVAAQTTNGFANWNAVLNVPTGTTTINVSVTDSAGNTDAAATTSTMANRGPVIGAIAAIGFDAARNRLILPDEFNGQVAAFRVSDGVGTMLSSAPPAGYAPDSLIPTAAAIDPANDRLLMIDSGSDALIAVNLVTGVQNVVSATDSNSAHNISGSSGVALDAANQLLYVAANNFPDAGVVRIDLANGQRTVTSSGSVGGGGLTPIQVNGVAFDNVTNPSTPRLLLSGNFATPSQLTGIVAIDIATGDRTEFSTSTPVGTGTALVAPTSMVIDAARNQLVVLDFPENKLVGVNLGNGNRTPLNSFTLGSGPYPSFVNALAINPATNTLFAGQNSGAVYAIDLTTQARTSLVNTDVGLSDRISAPQNLALVSEPFFGTSLIYLQGIQGQLYRLNPDTGTRSIVSWSAPPSVMIGTGPSLAGAVDFVVDRRPGAGNSVLVMVANNFTAQYELLSVDLATGNRTHVADVVSDHVDKYPMRMALDVAGNRVLYTNTSLSGPHIDQLFAIDLATGVTSTISDASSGNAATYPVLGNIVLEPAANPTRALVTKSDGFTGEIVSVDLATGARSLFDSPSAGSGVTYRYPGPMFLDAAGARLLWANPGYPANFVSRPLAGGARQLVSGVDPTSMSVRGTGPEQRAVSGVDVDTVNEVAYVTSVNSQSIMAIDLLSGDRIIIAR
jgi:hypothetical protein